MSNKTGTSKSWCITEGASLGSNFWSFSYDVFLDFLSIQFLRSLVFVFLFILSWVKFLIQVYEVCSYPLGAKKKKNQMLKYLWLSNTWLCETIYTCPLRTELSSALCQNSPVLRNPMFTILLTGSIINCMGALIQNFLPVGLCMFVDNWIRFFTWNQNS